MRRNSRKESLMISLLNHQTSRASGTVKMGRVMGRSSMLEASIVRSGSKSRTSASVRLVYTRAFAKRMHYGEFTVERSWLPEWSPTSNFRIL